jgi:FixJ family two-component response regulator
MTEKDPLVFVMDDDSSVRRALQRQLFGERIRVEASESGHQFLASYTVGRSGCRVVDIEAPDLNGLELSGATGL